VLFYHSSCEVPGVYGLAKVSRLAEPDESQFDTKSEYFDPKAKKENPTWYAVRVKYAKTFKRPVTLAAIKADAKLKDMFLFKYNRLSVGPVTAAEYEHILKLAA
jgi:predicted RNA-binding protein with PUA-like domain